MLKKEHVPRIFLEISKNMTITHFIKTGKIFKPPTRP
jgi:hypothetical protein